MSKKDLLERLTRAPSDSLRTRREDEGTPAARTEAVTTRVGKRVVRRRRKDEEAEPAPPPTTVRRRAAVVVQEPEVPAPVEAREEAPAPEPTAAAPAKPEPVEEAPQPQPAQAEPAKVEAPPEPQPEPEPARAEEPAAPEPSPEPTPEPAAEPSPPSPAAAALPEEPRYAGLGKAVVMPPPGYDPENPLAYRRQQAADAARPQPGATPAGRGRRRVEPGGDRADFRGRGRRGRQTPGPGGRGFDRRPSRGKRRKAGPKQASPTPKAQKRKVRVDNVISVRDLAMQLGVKASVVIRQLMDLGVMASITEMLDLDTAALVATEFDYEVENVGFQEQNYLETVEEAVEEENLQPRPPVVTIMGHVDHGKTTLLDTIRNSRVASGEAGGITQHIGAYQVETERGKVTFIDTPGHEAFTAMRARGAEVTDIVVLVVAADDGVQPQTLEAIAHAKAADVPIVVAVNKMDKVGVTAEPIMTRLSEHELVPEAWGGDTMFVPVSALKAEGIDDLLESILLQAEVLDLHANPDRFAEGLVLEAKMERGRGAVATVLVQRGTLQRGDHVVLGSAFGKVRAILDHNGKTIKSAAPSTPVELFGLSELPEVGDSVNAVKNEKNARALADHRAVAKRQEQMAKTRRRTAEDLFAQAAEVDRETMLLILKADVGGSLQALRTSVEQIEVEGAEVRLLLSSVGDITESDINLAASEGATVIGFNVKIDAKAREAASQQGVEPEFYSVIYDVLDRVEREMKGMLAPVYEQVRQGTVEVRQLFRISRIGTVAGSYVIDGKVGRNHTVKVLRDNEVIWEGRVSTLKRFKEDVREVAAGYECGLSLDGFDDLMEGDLIETYAEQVVEQA